MHANRIYGLIIAVLLLVIAVLLYALYGQSPPEETTDLAGPAAAVSTPPAPGQAKAGRRPPPSRTPETATEKPAATPPVPESPEPEEPTIAAPEAGREAERIVAETVVLDRARAAMERATTEQPKAQASADTEDAEYVGQKQCKMCHNMKAEGEQWNIWKAMKHAQAYTVLLDDMAREVAIAAGVTTPPAESPECLRCHVTGYDAEARAAPAKIALEDGVQCESCHGPASLHLDDGKQLKFATGDNKPDIDLSAHIRRPNEETCLECHNDENPTWNPERYTTESGETTDFDFEQATARIAHPNPMKAQ